jgi:hypothetical protein
MDKLIALKLKRVSTGHIPVIVEHDVEAVLTEYRDRILKREARILKSLKEAPGNIHEIAARRLIYREHPTSFVLFWEKSMLKKHFERLLSKRLIEKAENGVFRAV